MNNDIHTITANALADRIIAGMRLTDPEACRILLTAPLPELMRGADRIRRELCGDRMDLCSIINGRSGRCPENCKFCAQSAHNRTDVEEYPFIALEKVLADCEKYEDLGVDRYSVVTAGRTVTGSDLEAAVLTYKTLHERFPDMHLCGSHGLMTAEAFVRLKEVGVDMIHCNLETSRSFFPQICTTHSFDEKLEAIQRAKDAGLRICSGGIIGMGESWEDRIEMALELAGLEVKSIPLNVLVPIPGTPLENAAPISNEDVLRTVAIFRYLNPEALIRIAAGRSRFEDGGADLFRAGANATITGDMLTTVGNNTQQDRIMLSDMGFALRPAK